MTAIQRKITDFQPSNEQMVVSRVLVGVHKAIDEAFPNSRARERQFTKTVAVFGGPSEKTGLFPTEDKIPAPPTSLPPVNLENKEKKEKSEKTSRSKSRESSKTKVLRRRKIFDTIFIVSMYTFIVLILLYVLAQYAENVFFIHP